MTTVRYTIQSWYAGEWRTYRDVDTVSLGKTHIDSLRRQYPHDKYQLVKVTTEVLS